MLPVDGSKKDWLYSPIWNNEREEKCTKPWFLRHQRYNKKDSDSQEMKHVMWALQLPQLTALREFPGFVAGCNTGRRYWNRAQQTSWVEGMEPRVQGDQGIQLRVSKRGLLFTGRPSEFHSRSPQLSAEHWYVSVCEETTWGQGRSMWKR